MSYSIAGVVALLVLALSACEPASVAAPTPAVDVMPYRFEHAPDHANRRKGQQKKTPVLALEAAPADLRQG